MLEEIVVKGFKSFIEETTISFSSSNYSLLQDTNVYQNILKGLMFIGENGVGKSNIVQSIQLLLDTLYSNNNIDYQKYFCLFSQEKEMKFIFKFHFPNQIIKYQWIINEKCQFDEKLYLNQTEINLPNSNNRLKLFFVLENNPLFKSLKEYLKNSIYINEDKKLQIYSNSPIMLDQYLKECNTDFINQFLKIHHFDFQLFYDNELYIQKEGRNEKVPFAFESLGNKTFIQFLPILFHFQKNQGMFLMDEFTIGFHHKLEEFLIRSFMNNTKGSQIIFATHSANLLKTTLLRLDQMYIVQFDKDKGSHCHKISSYQPRESQNIEKMYLSGMFEGIPNYED